MQFNDINFTEGDGRYGSSRGLRIRGYWVSKDLFDLMWQSASSTMPNLDWSKPQTVVTLFGDQEEWISYPFGARIALGRCLKYFVDHDVLPIRLANEGKKGTRKYVRK